MKFKYQAKTKEGELQVGFVEAGSKETAVSILSSHDLFIMKLEVADTVRWYERLGSVFTGVKRSDMVVLTRQFATLLEARLPLNKALSTLQDQTENATLKEAVRQIQDDVDSGLSLSQAMERQTEIFSTFFVSMIRSAEVTGNLDQVSKFLADFTEREANLISKTRSAMIYPGIIVGLFVVVGVLMLTVVFPQIKPVFEESNVQLPVLTQIFLGAGEFILHYWIPIVVVLLMIIGIIMEYIQTPEGKALKDDLKVRLPIFRNIFLPITTTRFANASAMLLKGGVPITQAMEIVGETLDNALYRDLLHDISEEISRGVPLSQAVAEQPAYFPPLVSQMLAVGETTGQVDEMFLRIAAFYTRESDAVVNNLVELIQPVLMIGIGLMVGLLFAAILMPLYNLTSSIQ